MNDAAASTNPAADERLAYRSIFQRSFIRPEVGAIIGAIGIWTFFWAVSETFGTAGGTLSWLDIVASGLGIMAVAVSMLMIGGEFDLSSGAMTGAMAMLLVFIVKETGELGGAGLPMTVALPLSLLVALGIGWMNGTMVERTGQPSFIITLATFFSLKGLKLGLANRFVGQIQVASTEEASDYDFWRKIFAAEWQRNDHQLGSRDFWYIVLPTIGVTLIILAVYELWFKRRDTLNPAGLVQFLVGAGAIALGVILMHSTDGTGANTLIAFIISAGVVVGSDGWCAWRYERTEEFGSVSITGQMQRRVGLGLVLVVVGSAIALLIDSASENEIIFPFTTQGVRAMLFVAIASVGLAYLAMASQAALSVNPATKRAVTLALAIGVGIVAATIFLDSESPKFRAALFPLLLFAAVLLVAWSNVSSRYVERRYSDIDIDRKASIVVALGCVLAIIGLAIRLLFTVDEEIEAGIAPAKASIRIFWFGGFTVLLMWVLASTRFGGWTFAVGGNKEASRQVGVPAARTKTQLFMLVSTAAWLVGVLIAFRINSIQANTGDGLEFQYIIAAVVGGTLLTGGYGTAFGGAIGAAIMAMPLIGISAARWNTDWRFLFIGVVLLVAVVANRFIRTKAEGIRR